MFLKDTTYLEYAYDINAENMGVVDAHICNVIPEDSESVDITRIV